MTTQEIYEKLHDIDVIANLEAKSGIWYIENTISEMFDIDDIRSKPTSYYPTLKEAVEGLQESQDWFAERGSGLIHFREYGLNAKDINIYRGKPGEFGMLQV